MYDAHYWEGGGREGGGICEYQPLNQMYVHHKLLIVLATNLQQIHIYSIYGRFWIWSLRCLGTVCIGSDIATFFQSICHVEHSGANQSLVQH